MPKDYGDVGSEDGDNVPGDADLDDIPAVIPEVNGDRSDHASSKKAAATEDPDDTGDDDEDDEDDEDDGESFQVESIVRHRKHKGILEFFIKWVGYPEDQNTWEPEANLLPSARIILSDYFEQVGGEAKLKGTLKKSKSTAFLRRDDSIDDSPTVKRRKVEDEDDGTWLPKGSDWSDYVTQVDTIERDETGQLQVYLRFKNDKRTKVSMEQIKKHCPVPMLEFYEKHLKFKLDSERDI